MICLDNSVSASDGSFKSIIYALIANGVIAILKFGAWFFTMSGAMLAEAIHSVADCGNQLLLLLGQKRSRLPPTEEYPLGYGKAVYFWSFMVAIMLFSVGGCFSLYEGFHKLGATERIPHAWLAITVLAISIVIEGFSFYGCLIEVNRERGDKSYSQWFRETRQSELLVVFGEDLAALLGLTFALIFVVIADVTGNPVYDAIGSMVIGVLLIVVAIFVTIQIKKLIVGRSADISVREGIDDYLTSSDHIDEIYNIITLQLGPNIMVSVKAKMNPELSAEAMVEKINLLEEGLKERYPQILWLFFEPDCKD